MGSRSSPASIRGSSRRGSRSTRATKCLLDSLPLERLSGDRPLRYGVRSADAVYNLRVGSTFKLAT